MENIKERLDQIDKIAALRAEEKTLMSELHGIAAEFRRNGGNFGDKDRVRNGEISKRRIEIRKEINELLSVITGKIQGNE
jgi:uncharacterized protein YeeX (DUF496 family)